MSHFMKHRGWKKKIRPFIVHIGFPRKRKENPRNSCIIHVFRKEDSFCRSIGSSIDRMLPGNGFIGFQCFLIKNPLFHAQGEYAFLILRYPLSQAVCPLDEGSIHCFEHFFLIKRLLQGKVSSHRRPLIVESKDHHKHDVEDRQVG